MKPGVSPLQPPARWVLMACLLLSVATLCVACGDAGEGDGQGGTADQAKVRSESAVSTETDAAAGAGVSGLDDGGSYGGAAVAESVSAGGLPSLLDLGADKCVPCKAMAPILDEMRETFDGQLAVVFIDVWKNREPALEYGVKVIPTQIFLDAEGNELFRHQGFFSREDMLAKWRELGYEFDGQAGS